MDARNNLKIIHTVDGAILQNRYGKAVIRSHDIGLISLPTGEIVMADPTLRFEIADFKRKAFQQKVSPGIYPVFAYSAHAGEDRTLAFAEIRFTDQPPVTFTAAKTICDAEQSSRRNCGYVVNESTTGLMDGRFFRSPVCALIPLSWITRLPLMNFWRRIWNDGASTAQQGSLRMVIIQLPFLRFRVASITGTGERAKKARSAA